MLILSPISSDFFGFEKWNFDNIKHSFVFLTTSRAKDSYSNFGDNCKVYTISEWKQDLVLMKAKIIYSSECYDKVIAIDEFDIEIAACIRDYFDLKGQNLENAKFFRDKLIMNKLVREKGISAPITSEISNIFELDKFGKSVSYPIIVKPKNGAGTMKTFKIDSYDDAVSKIDFDLSEGNYIAQKFIKGELYHIDSLVIKGVTKFTKVSKYLAPTLQHFNGISAASALLDKSESEMFVDFTEQLFKRIPLPENSLIHLEVFYDGHEIHFLEIASRIGGGGIHEILNKLFHADPLQSYVLAELNDYNLVSSFEEKYDKSLGWIMVSPKKGKVVSLPEYDEEVYKSLGIFDIKYFAKLGTKYEKAQYSGHSICRLCLEGKNYNDVSSKLILAEKSVNSQLIYQLEE